jgi:hypothetical protein
MGASVSENAQKQPSVVLSRETNESTWLESSTIPENAVIIPAA